MKDEIRLQFEEYYERIATRSRGNLFNAPKFNSLDELISFRDVGKLRIEQVIGKAILDFENEFPKVAMRLRGDAKVLLIINFSDMVYYPLVQGGGQNRFELKKEIYKEVHIILKEASISQEIISSHKILEVGLKLWERLKTLGEDSW